VSYVINAGDLVAVTPGNLLCKYADDTYVTVLAINVQNRNAEVQNIEQWATANNLTLNRGKSMEMIFTTRHCSQVSLLPALPDIRRVMSLKMLGVTMTNHLSASEHVSDYQ